MLAMLTAAASSIAVALKAITDQSRVSLAKIKEFASPRTRQPIMRCSVRRECTGDDRL
jgi:hypothetical protein